MKIAMLGPAPPFRGGISQFALMLAKEWLPSGHMVRMYTFTRQYPRLLFPGGSQTTEFRSVEGINIERVFAPYLPHTWPRAVQAIVSWQPDILIVSYFLPWFAPSYAWICQRCRKTRIVCLAHNIDFHEKWPGARFLTLLLLKLCDRIVVLSQASLQDLRNKSPSAIAARAVLGFHPLYDCYEADPRTVNLVHESQPTMLFFGLIKPYKGLDILLQALKQAQASLPELKLIVAGEVYGKKEKYSRQIRQLGLVNAVETHFRYIGETEIASFFQRSQVCILPYKSATQSGVISTAYHFQVPVIVTDAGGLREYVEEGVTGLVVPASNVEALAAAIIRYFKQDSYSLFKQNIPDYTHNMSWSRLSRLILER